MILDSNSSIIFSEDSASLLEIRQLVSRIGLWPQLLRRQQEEELVRLIPVDPKFLNESRAAFLGSRSLQDVLSDKRWSVEDLDMHLSRPEALRIYAEQRFGSGLEEDFLSSGGQHDQVIYSVLRVRDPGLAQELWIRLAEGEASFAELASTYGEGPESARKGIIGPTPVGSIVPEQLAQLLRNLKASEIHQPVPIGDWIVLLRLEQLTLARFDSDMRKFLLDQQLNNFLDTRVQSIIDGHPVENLTFDIDS